MSTLLRTDDKIVITCEHSPYKGMILRYKGIQYGDKDIHLLEDSDGDTVMFYGHQFEQHVLSMYKVGERVYMKDTGDYGTIVSMEEDHLVVSQEHVLYYNQIEKEDY